VPDLLNIGFMIDWKKMYLKLIKLTLLRWGFRLFVRWVWALE